MKMNRVKIIWRGVNLGFLLLGLCSSGLWAQADKGGEAAPGEKRQTKETKTVTGEVSAITRDFIAIIYSRNVDAGSEEEIALPIAKDFQLKRKTSLDQIQVGDTVEVEYEDTNEEYQKRNEQGAIEKKTKVVEREAKVITFVRPGQTTGLYSGEGY
jgi:hypothetical protein